MTLKVKKIPENNFKNNKRKIYQLGKDSKKGETVSYQLVIITIK